MKTYEELLETPHLVVIGRVQHTEPLGKYHVYTGYVEWQDLEFRGSVIFGFDEAGLMEHVSLCPDHKKKLPSWEVMCRLKDMFWNKDEMVVQIHPPEKYYVHGVGLSNRRENILHLWRPMNGDWSVLNHPEDWC